MSYPKGNKMFKPILILLFIMICLQSTSALAKQYISGVINHVEIGVYDEAQTPTLCITYITSELTHKTYGIVEDIRDCYFARKMTNRIDSYQAIPSSHLFELYIELETHLLTKKDNVQYVFSEVE